MFKSYPNSQKRRQLLSRSHAVYFHSYDKVFTAGDHIGVKLDNDRGTMTFFKNDKELYEIILESHFMNEDLFPCVGFYNAKGGIVHLVKVKQGT